MYRWDVLQLMTNTFAEHLKLSNSIMDSNCQNDGDKRNSHEGINLCIPFGIYICKWMCTITNGE